MGKNYSWGRRTFLFGHPQEHGIDTVNWIEMLAFKFIEDAFTQKVH